MRLCSCSYWNCRATPCRAEPAVGAGHVPTGAPRCRGEEAGLCDDERRLVAAHECPWRPRLRSATPWRSASAPRHDALRGDSPAFRRHTARRQEHRIAVAGIEREAGPVVHHHLVENVERSDMSRRNRPAPGTSSRARTRGLISTPSSGLPSGPSTPPARAPQPNSLICGSPRHAAGGAQRRVGGPEVGNSV